MNAQQLTILLELANRANRAGLVRFEEYPAVYEAVKVATEQVQQAANQPIESNLKEVPEPVKK